MVFIAQGDWEIHTHILHAFLQSGKIKAYLLELQQRQLKTCKQTS